MTQQIDAPQPQPPVDALAWIPTKIAGLALFALAYWLAVRFGLWLEFQPQHIASIWPVSGLALAVLLLRPRREWPGLLGVVFVTNALGNWMGGHNLLVSLGIRLVLAALPRLAAIAARVMAEERDRPLAVAAA